MRQSPFVWLGSGRSRKRGVAEKGKLLDLAARGGLPVPQGGILLDEFYRICLDEGVLEVIERRVIVPDPVWLFEVMYRDIRFPRLKNAVAVRAATAVSSANQLSQFAQLDVDFNNPQQMAKALRKLWSDLLSMDEDPPMDVLVMSMVDGKTYGAAATTQNKEDDQTTIFSESEEAAQTMLLPRIRFFRGSSAGLPPYACRLQRLLAGVRRTFGKGDYIVDWADDGSVCWLMQIR